MRRRDLNPQEVTLKSLRNGYLPGQERNPPYHYFYPHQDPNYRVPPYLADSTRFLELTHIRLGVSWDRLQEIRNVEDRLKALKEVWDQKYFKKDSDLMGCLLYGIKNRSWLDIKFVVREVFYRIKVTLCLLGDIKYNPQIDPPRYLFDEASLGAINVHGGYDNCSWDEIVVGRGLLSGWYYELQSDGT